MEEKKLVKNLRIAVIGLLCLSILFAIISIVLTLSQDELIEYLSGGNIAAAVLTILFAVVALVAFLVGKKGGAAIACSLIALFISGITVWFSPYYGKAAYYLLNVASILLPIIALLISLSYFKSCKEDSFAEPIKAFIKKKGHLIAITFSAVVSLILFITFILTVVDGYKMSAGGYMLWLIPLLLLIMTPIILALAPKMLGFAKKFATAKAKGDPMKRSYVLSAIYGVIAEVLLMFAPWIGVYYGFIAWILTIPLNVILAACFSLYVKEADASGEKANPRKNEIDAKLRDLKDLLDGGIISQKEYDVSRQNLLKELESIAAAEAASASEKKDTSSFNFHDYASELSDAKALLDGGILTQEEYEQEKARINAKYGRG